MADQAAWPHSFLPLSAGIATVRQMVLAAAVGGSAFDERGEKLTLYRIWDDGSVSTGAARGRWLIPPLARGRYGYFPSGAIANAGGRTFAYVTATKASQIRRKMDEQEGMFEDAVISLEGLIDDAYLRQSGPRYDHKYRIEKDGSIRARRDGDPSPGYNSVLAPPLPGVSLYAPTGVDHKYITLTDALCIRAAASLVLGVYDDYDAADEYIKLAELVDAGLTAP